MKNKIDFAVGGQALMEGVMMRSPNYVSIACRKQNGEFITQTYCYQNIIRKYKFLNIPILRGFINMIEMLFIGTKAMNFSTDIFVEDESDDDTDTDSQTNSKSDSQSSKSSPQKAEAAGTLVQVLGILLSIAISMSLAILIFKVIPLATASFAKEQSAFLSQNYIAFNALDAVIKIVLFAAYLKLMHCSKMLRRVFGFHAAEHMSIAAYEQDLNLSQEQIAKQTRFHPRCGTSFLVFVFLLSIFVYTFLPQSPYFITNLSLRVATLPLLAGISYELLKLSAKFPKSAFSKFMSFPGLMFQRLTTLPPEPEMLDTAALALKNALDLESKHK